MVVKSEGEHSVETAEATNPPAFVGLENYLGVGVAGKSAARLFEFLPDLLEIVDLAVEDDPHLLFRIGHGLMSGRRKIKDRKPAKGQPHSGGGIVEISRVIGAAVDKLVAHLLEQCQWLLIPTSPHIGLDAC